MQNKILYCRDCHKSFEFTVNAQLEYAAKNWDDPCRCRNCRKAKKKRGYDPYKGWQSTMTCPRYTKRGHQRVQYSGAIVAGGLSQ